MSDIDMTNDTNEHNANTNESATQQSEQVQVGEESKQKKSVDKKERKTISKMTPDEIKEVLEKKRKELAALEAQLHGAGLIDLIKTHKVVEAINKVKDDAKDAGDLLILKTIGEALGIKRLVVTQAAVVERAKRKKE